jgi:hypothetical protein
VLGPYAAVKVSPGLLNRNTYFYDRSGDLLCTRILCIINALTNLAVGNLVYCIVLSLSIFPLHVGMDHDGLMS